MHLQLREVGLDAMGLPVVGGAVARFVLSHAVSVIWTRASSTSTVVHALHPQSWLSPQPSHHHHLLRDTDYDHDGARAVASASAPTMPDYDGLPTAAEAPPYTRMGCNSIEPMVLQRQSHYWPSTRA
jgi:hypothetical protein